MKMSLVARSLTLALAATLSLPVIAALKAGDAAPDFSAPASLNGKPFTYALKDALKKGPVVVYFYPSAFTGGCNAQAHAFAESMDQFNAAGATVVGVSLDSIARLNEFSADPNYCAGRLPVVSDADGKIARSYDLSIREVAAGAKDTRGVEIGHGMTERTTFIVTRDGRVSSTIGGVTPTANVDAALAAVRALKARQ